MREALRLASGPGRGALAATVLGSGVVFLDTTVVNVALPTLGRELGAGMAGLQWTVDAYLLTLGALLLVGGALGDRYGRRRVYALGLVLFALASAACGLAPSLGALVAARALQGVAGALLVPGSLAMLRAVVAEEDQGRAIGLWSGLSGVTTALGPLVGGWLIEVASWRAAFFINLPLGVLALGLLRRFMPESRDEEAPPAPDFLGGALATLGLAGAVFALIEGPAQGWSAGTLVAGILGVLLLAAFVRVEGRRPQPMLPLGLFQSRAFAGANATTLGLYFALGGATFFVVLQLQGVLGYSPLEAGAALLPVTLLMLLLSPLAGRLARQVGHRTPMTLGPAVAALGLALLAGVGPGSSYWGRVLPGVSVLGLGLCAAVAPLTDAVLAAAPRRHAGVASGVNNAVARLAGLLAVALLPWAAGLAGGGMGEAAALDAGYGRAMWLSALAAALASAVAFATMGARRQGAQ